MHAMYYVSYMTQELLWHTDEKLRELENGIRPEDIAAFIPPLLSQIHIEGMVHGNMEEEDALKLAEIVEDAFKPRPLPMFQRFPSMRTQLLRPGQSFIHIRQVPNAENLNSAIEYYLQLGDYEDGDVRALSSLFAQIVREPCFDQLRTKEQLGYMVFSGLRKQTGVIGFRVIIQSERDPLYVESRIESFLRKMRTYLLEMTDEEFSKHKAALISRYLEKDKNLAQESRRLWAHVNSRYLGFSEHLHDAERVKTITRDELMAFFDTHLSVQDVKSSGGILNPHRKKLSVHMRSQKKVGPISSFTSSTIAPTQAAAETVENAVTKKEEGAENGEEVLPSPGTEGERALIDEILARNNLVVGEDLHDFKARLELSKGAAPIRPIKQFMKLKSDGQ
ncbi:Insulinase (Peptidase M16) [Quaeritorhiza haematococci]|nr:Insulinase (Peptidase M16) [Quaeritorhiza haematococci]